MDFKKCFVPSCKNTSMNSKKIFISVPKNEEIRRKWSITVGRSKIPATSSAGIYCCEDHFKMEDDCENWIGYKLFNKQLKIKRDVVPHRNLSGKSDVPSDQSQFTRSAEKRKQRNIEQYNIKKQKLTPRRLEFGEGPSSIPDEIQKEFLELPSSEPMSQKCHKTFSHKKIQACIKNEVRTIGINTTTKHKTSLAKSLQSTSHFNVSLVKKSNVCSPSTSSVSTKTDSEFVVTEAESSESNVLEEESPIKK